MSIFTKREARDLFCGGEGTQVFDQLARKGLIERDLAGYYVQRDGIRDSIESSARTWRYIKQRSLQRPNKPDKILERLVETRVNRRPLILFSPWGPRYGTRRSEITEDDPELKTLREVSCVIQFFNGEGYEIEYLLMPADAYGTEVNGLPKTFVSDYFKWLKQAAEKIIGVNCRLIVKPWSEIRMENKDSYEKLAAETGGNLSQKMPEGEYKRSVEVARKFNPENPEENARKYCIERIVEAKIVETCFNPIKMSLVRKEKDTLDGELKRIYILPEGLRAPWLEVGD